MNNKIVFAVVFFGTLAAQNLPMPSGAGIVTLPDYRHAVVLCGEATVINEGHESDPEVQELLALAAEVCPK